MILGAESVLCSGSLSLDGTTSYFGSALLSAVNSGTVPMSRLNDMATRVLASW